MLRTHLHYIVDEDKVWSREYHYQKFLQYFKKVFNPEPKQRMCLLDNDKTRKLEDISKLYDLREVKCNFTITRPNRNQNVYRTLWVIFFESEEEELLFRITYSIDGDQFHNFTKKNRSRLQSCLWCKAFYIS